MKFKKSTLLIPILSVVLSAHAISPSPTVYSGAILTMGGNSTIYGNLQVAAAATLGATSTVGGDLIAGGALTLGTGGNVGGDLISGAAIAVGTASTIEDASFCVMTLRSPSRFASWSAILCSTWAIMLRPRSP